MLVMEQNQKSAIKFYDNGPYCYKFADILKDNNKLYWIKIAPWEKVRTFWIKVVELTEYLGQYKAYDGILRYMFGDDINHSSSCTASIQHSTASWYNLDPLNIF